MNPGPLLPLFDPRLLMVTWFYSGFLRPASGTWGTLAALPFAYAVHVYAGPYALIGAALLLYLLALPCIRWYERKSGSHDSSRIVIDEVIGIFIALTPAQVNIIDYAAAFFLFRAFDAIKPGPIGWVDTRVSGAHGVLLDDVIAGILAACGVMAVHALAGV